MVLSIVIIVVALAGSAFISASEAGLLAVNRIRMRSLAAAGNRRASAVMDILGQHEKFFGSILLTGNIFNILIASVSTALAISLAGDSGVAVGVATAIATVLVVVFGELTPKSLATLAAERWSLTAAQAVRCLMMLIGPFVYVFTLIPRGITHLLGGHEALRTPSVTETELRMLIDMGEAEGTVESTQGQMLEKIFRFGETEVSEVMTPRPEIIWVNADTRFGEFLEIYREHPHTRFPVYDEEEDDVVGVLSVKDAMASLAGGELDLDQPVARIMRAALFVPETKRLDELFDMLQETGHKMALAVDEFGGIAGIITLTRVVEQIVGRTGEEGRRPQERFVTVSEDTFVVDGGMSVDEANDELELGIPEGDYDTVAGFVVDLLQHIPEAGERLRYNDLRMQVLEMDGRKISRITVRRGPRVLDQDDA